MQYSLYPLSQFGQIYKQLPPFGVKIFIKATIFTRGRTPKIVDVLSGQIWQLLRGPMNLLATVRNYFSNKAEVMEKTTMTTVTVTSRNKGLLAKQQLWRMRFKSGTFFSHLLQKKNQREITKFCVYGRKCQNYTPVLQVHLELDEHCNYIMDNTRGSQWGNGFYG